MKKYIQKPVAEGAEIQTRKPTRRAETDELDDGFVFRCYGNLEQGLIDIAEDEGR